MLSFALKMSVTSVTENNYVCNDAPLSCVEMFRGIINLYLKV